MPTTGDVRIFALLIEFSDIAHTNALPTINDALFGTPSTGMPYESLSAFYRRSSYGALELGGGITLGWYQTPRRRSQVIETTAGREGLIREALEHFRDQGQNFGAFDNNGDGVIDYFMVFWAGPDTGWGTFWWGQKRTFSDSSFVLDGLTLGDYSWQWESRPVGAAFNPRVAIHETGHALGLPDLYDYDDGVGPDGGVGGFDMMDSNNYDHNAFSKWLLDWIAPATLSSGDAKVTLRPSGTTQDCMALWPGIDEDDLFSELFIVQNRQPVANDSRLAGGGLAIWHIDAHLGPTGEDFACDNSYTSCKLVRLMEADGREDIESGRGFDASDLYVAGRSLGESTKEL